MLRIGLIGAPGARKSALARSLATELGKREEHQFATIVDDYVEAISEETDLALGFYATYIGNLYVAMGRFSRERKAEFTGADVIVTCGTLIENQVYAAVEGASSERYADLEEEHRKRTVVSMQMMGLFMQDLFQYDHLFYLPLQGEHDKNLHSFDENLPQAIELWDIKATTLSGDDQERLDLALSEVPRIGVASVKADDSTNTASE